MNPRGVGNSMQIELKGPSPGSSSLIGRTIRISCDELLKPGFVIKVLTPEIEVSPLQLRSLAASIDQHQ